MPHLVKMGNRDRPSEDNRALEALTRSVLPLAKEIRALHEEACAAYAPMVERACAGTLSQRELEHLLDGMLDFAGASKMLAMYKRVLRRYLYVYPETVYGYVMAWREMYDAGEETVPDNDPV